jgi:3-hydroxymyristoyl/3-hydroxydecanoyl-(acyl carrier protein) dehydratase
MQRPKMRDGLIEPLVLARRQNPEGIELDLRIVADLASLRGHFPGLPIVPGVCLLDWAVRNAVRHCGLLEAAAPRFQVKFRHVLQPGNEVTLLLRPRPDGGVRFEYRRAAAIYATGTILPAEA